MNQTYTALIQQRGDWWIVDRRNPRRELSRKNARGTAGYPENHAFGS